MKHRPRRIPRNGASSPDELPVSRPVSRVLSDRTMIRAADRGIGASIIGIEPVPVHGEVNQIFEEEAETKRYAGVLGVSRDPFVSSDIVGDPRASIVDLELTRVIDGDLVKVMSWYDNEWGYANQILREALSVTSGR